jgi:hypothetical protein
VNDKPVTGEIEVGELEIWIFVNGQCEDDDEYF